MGDTNIGLFNLLPNARTAQALRLGLRPAASASRARAGAGVSRAAGEGGGVVARGHHAARILHLLLHVAHPLRCARVTVTDSGDECGEVARWRGEWRVARLQCILAET